MHLDAIEHISEVEKQAEEIVAKARLDAREVAQHALKQGADLRAERIARQNEDIQAALLAAQTEAEAYTRARIADAQSVCEALALEARANMSTAVALITGRVVTP